MPERVWGGWMTIAVPARGTPPVGGVRDIPCSSKARRVPGAYSKQANS